MCEGAELIPKSEYKVSRFDDMKSLQTYCKTKTLQARVETSPGVAQPLPPTSIPKKPGPGGGCDGDRGGSGGGGGGVVVVGGGGGGVGVGVGEDGGGEDGGDNVA